MTLNESLEKVNPTKTKAIGTVFGLLRQFETGADRVIAALPNFDNDQLAKVRAQARVLGRCGWRIEIAAEAEAMRRMAEHQAGGRGKRDDAGQGVDATLRRLAAELGTTTRSLYKGAEIHRTFFRETTENVFSSLAERGYYEAALATDTPHQTLAEFAQRKVADHTFGVRDAWRMVRALKAPPLDTPRAPLIEDAAVRRAWKAYGLACAELARASAAAGVPLSRLLREYCDELRPEIQRPGTTRRQQLLELIAEGINEVELIALRLAVDRIWVATWLDRLQDDGVVESFEKERAPGARGAARTGYRLKPRAVATGENRGTQNKSSASI